MNNTKIIDAVTAGNILAGLAASYKDIFPSPTPASQLWATAPKDLEK